MVGTKIHSKEIISACGLACDLSERPSFSSETPIPFVLLLNLHFLGFR